MFLLLVDMNITSSIVAVRTRRRRAFNGSLQRPLFTLLILHSNLHISSPLTKHVKSKVAEESVHIVVFVMFSFLFLCVCAEICDAALVILLSYRCETTI